MRYGNQSAFPLTEDVIDFENSAYNMYGMTLREYLVAHAPEPPQWLLNHFDTLEQCADAARDWAFAYADSLLAALDKSDAANGLIERCAREALTSVACDSSGKWRRHRTHKEIAEAIRALGKPLPMPNKGDQ